MKKISFLLLVSLLVQTTLFAEDFILRGKNFGNFFTMQSGVEFKGNQKIAKDDKLVGTIFDWQNKQVAQITISGEEFNNSNWKWQPTVPGFYEIEFTLNGKTVTDTYSLSIPHINPKTHKAEVLAKRDFAISRHAVVVTAEPTKKSTDISPIFAASLHLWAGDLEIPLSALIGFRTLRYHVVSWDQIELAKGQFNWSDLDRMIEKSHQAGYQDNQIVFNVCDTAKWAAKRPDMEHNENPGASPLYRGVAPADIQDWKDFLIAIANRYPKVVRYEMWNEPNFPGYSAFFYEPPEKFVPIDIEGYKTLKAINPEIEVILHGFEGKKYREYYKTILEMGVDKSFDVLGLHQYNADIAPYRVIERQLGVTSRPWINTEWHGAFYNPLQPNIPSETDMPKNMVLSFLRQAYNGAEEIHLFSLLNLSTCERENVDFLREYKYNFTHLSGLFRRRPYVQPRYIAAAWQVFTNSFSGKLTIGDGYNFAPWEVQSISDDNKLVLFVYHNGATELSLDPKIVAAIGDQSEVVLPDGTPFDYQKDKVQPGSYLLIRNANKEIVKSWTNKKFLLSFPELAQLPLVRDCIGKYRNGLLFDSNLKDIMPSQFVYQHTGKNIVANPNASAAQIKASFAVGFNKEYFDLIAVVQDPRHCDHPNADDMEVWNSDSIQFAIDTTNKGHAGERLEFAVARSKDGKVNVWKVVAPGQNVEMSSGRTDPGNKVRFSKATFERKNGKSIYRIRIKASEFLPKILKPEELRICFLANNNDGNGRAYYTSWSDGIGDVKDPTLYGSLFARANSRKLPKTQELCHIGWSGNYGFEKKNWESDKASVKITIGDQQIAGVFSEAFSVTPGCRYRVSFKAKGSTRLIFSIDPARTGQGGMPRQDLLITYPLTDEYKDFSFEFMPKEGQSKCGFMFFGWEQFNTYFEITDFKVETL